MQEKLEALAAVACLMERFGIKEEDAKLIIKRYGRNLEEELEMIDSNYQRNVQMIRNLIASTPVKASATVKNR